MTFKKADMAKTLKIRFSMIEMNPLNHKWLDFVILTGLALHQFQTNWLLSRIHTSVYSNSFAPLAIMFNLKVMKEHLTLRYVKTGVFTHRRNFHNGLRCGLHFIIKVTAKV